MLNLNPIRERLAQQFKPFVIHLTDGRKFRVPHPDFIAVGRGVVSVIDARDVTHTLDALHIVSIADEARAAKRNGN
ncbi:MAG: hypothetical protein DVB27_14490 [Verrucomicrobia bacterium]|nr:MAG: hypothetical protein DVB27_14490 [Verrucomicrobiota bacterium]